MPLINLYVNFLFFSRDGVFLLIKYSAARIKVDL